jgi:hypothetical protein
MLRLGARLRELAAFRKRFGHRRREGITIKPQEAVTAMLRGTIAG